MPWVIVNQTPNLLLKSQHFLHLFLARDLLPGNFLPITLQLWLSFSRRHRCHNCSRFLASLRGKKSALYLLISGVDLWLLPFRFRAVGNITFCVCRSTQISMKVEYSLKSCLCYWIHSALSLKDINGGWRWHISTILVSDTLKSFA